MELTKIVITGGPCGGKSTAMEAIRREFAQRGYTVLVIPETATELITGGVAPWTCGTNGDYQTLQLKLQRKKEEIFELAARTMTADRILLVCDRGAADSRAYMTEAEFAAALKELNTDEATLLGSYDGVFHLVTAAKGAEGSYTTENNAARTETPTEAAVLDDRVIAAWKGHPHFRVIDNSTDFEGKIRRLTEEIAAFLEEHHM